MPLFLMFALALQISPPEAMRDDLLRLGETISVAVHCSRLGYAVDLEAAHALEAQLEARAAEVGIEDSEAAEIMNAGWARRDAQLPPRNLPEDANDSDFLASWDTAKSTWPGVCRQLSADHPEILNPEGVDAVERDLIERLDLYRQMMNVSRLRSPSQ